MPNCRFLTIPSDNLGQDWEECSRQLDANLDELSLDLADESVYILFDRFPGAVLDHEGEALVARSVIGPKKNLPEPFGLKDWVQALVYRKVILASNWGHILEESFKEWENLQRQGHEIAAPFMIVAKRRLTPELALSVEVLFHE